MKKKLLDYQIIYYLLMGCCQAKENIKKPFEDTTQYNLTNNIQYEVASSENEINNLNIKKIKLAILTNNIAELERITNSECMGFYVKQVEKYTEYLFETYIFNILKECITRNTTKELFMFIINVKIEKYNQLFIVKSINGCDKYCYNDNYDTILTELYKCFGMDRLTYDMMCQIKLPATIYKEICLTTNDKKIFRRCIGRIIRLCLLSDSTGCDKIYLEKLLRDIAIKVDKLFWDSIKEAHEYLNYLVSIEDKNIDIENFREHINKSNEYDLYMNNSLPKYEYIITDITAG